MNTHQKHESLVNEYHEAANTVRRFRMYAFAFQAGIWILLFCLRNLHVQQVNWIAAVLFGLFLASRFRDFNLRRNLDIRMTQVTLEGVKLEKNTARLENFFHGVLQQFGVIRIMILRAMFDLVALYLFVSAVYRLVLDYNPDLALNIKTYYPALGILGFFLSDLYYKPIKAVMKAKQEIFSN
ncbi:MAG: hypothetical protein ACRDFB_04605 [Rhabdochlamydiaceae bacterium]